MQETSSSTQSNKNNISVWLLGAFLLILAVAAPWLNTSISNHAFTKSFTAVIGAGLLFLFTLKNNFSSSSQTWKINTIKLTLLLLFIFGALSTFWSINFDFAVSKFLLWLAALWCFIVGLHLPNNKNHLEQVAWALIISAGTIAIIGILQHLFDPFSLTQAAEPASTFGNKNMATQPLVLIFPLFAFLLLSNQVQGLKVWGLTTLTSFIFIYIIYTNTRAVWLSVSVELLLMLGYLIINRANVKHWLDWDSNKRNASIFALILTVTLINFSAEGFVNFLSIGWETFWSVADSANNTSSPRYQIWQTAVNMINDSPIFGSGLGSFSHNLSNEGYVAHNVVSYERAHNDLLELAVELGLIGISLFGAVVFALLTISIKIIKSTKGKTQYYYYTLLVALVGSFVNLQFSFPYQMAVPLVLFGLYSGMIAKKHDTIKTPIMSFYINVITRKVFLVFWLIAFFLVCTIYLSWFNMYTKLNNLNLEKNYSDLTYIQTPIYHQNIHNLLSKTSRVYFELGDLQTSSRIDDQILQYWPNHISSLYRKSSGGYKQNNPNEALKYAKMLNQVSPEGLFVGNIIELLVYKSTGKSDKFLESYNQLLSQPERLLALDQNTYHFLLFFTIGIDKLSEHPPNLYKKYTEYHGYSCEVENNYAIYLFNKRQFQKAAQHVDIITSKGDKCLNLHLVQLLDEKGLLNI